MPKRFILSLALMLATAGSALATPLFPDVKDGHWAKDAVAALAAKGLLEGYPDGTFKGDRAATRWEVAMIVARLLAKREQSSATFASQAELADLRTLVDSLRDELAALGVRVTHQEENTARLDQRVTELERITFYGSVDANVVTQTFYNRGALDNDNLRGGLNSAARPLGIPYQNYNIAVGTGPAGAMNPQNNGVFPVVNFTNGRPLSNGSGLTTRAILGVKVRLSDELRAGLELASYTSAGDQTVNGYYGVYAPYLSSPVVYPAAATPASANALPFTRMTLDHLWLEHLPSKTKVTLGYLDSLAMDPLVYAGMPNIGVFGPPRIPGFGVRATGAVPLEADSSFRWEAVGTEIGHGNVYLNQSYQHLMEGADVAYQFKQGVVKLNFSHYHEDSLTGAPLAVGLITTNNFAPGAAAGWTPLQWVNPPGYFAAQRGAFQQANTGIAAGGQFQPNTVDNRPIAGWKGSADTALGLGSGGGNYGPQEQTSYGVSGHYDFSLGGDNQLGVAGEYAHTDFRPNHNSSYSKGGDALRAELNAALCQNSLLLGVSYLSVDPTYGPTVLIGNLFGVNFPTVFGFGNRFQLHDFVGYPNNREGWRFRANWDFDAKHGSLWANGSSLRQKQTSLYDVRSLAGSLAAGTPTADVIGFSPGFVDYVFSGFANPNVYGPTSQNSFSAALAPFENPRGQVAQYGGGASYRWDSPRVALKATWDHEAMFRNSSLSPMLGGSQNYVNVKSDNLHFGLDWDPCRRWTMHSGLDLVHVNGHSDPVGLYNGFAMSTGSVTFLNLDTTQTIPYLGFTYQMSENLTFDLTGRYFITTDHLGSNVFAGLNTGAVGATVHPFSWSGTQVLSQFSLKF